jgi:5-methylcytosine-specific restriction endonuclease McrA
MSETLSTSVLVVNKHYSPVSITSARRAFCMLWGKIAEVITVENEAYINYDFRSWSEISRYKRLYEDNGELDWVFTPTLTLMVPRVVRLLRYDRLGGYKVKLTRKNLYYRDSNTCQYCGGKFKTKNLNIDHVVPRSRGGRDTWRNLVCACIGCNIRKGSRLPREAGMKLIREPKKINLNPIIQVHLRKKKYSSWKAFVDDAYWNVELID